MSTNQSRVRDQGRAADEGAAATIIGIDLGTTNSAVSHVSADLASGRSAPIKIFRISQLTGPGELNRLSALPSFLYLPGDYDVDPKALAHPWPKSSDSFVGVFARDQGAKVPGRLVSSAKSWLSHSNVDRHARILPWGAPEEVRKLSPVQASSAYLEHIKKAWNHARGDEEELFLENQSVILTVPASFDEVARELTLAAAKMAGFNQVTLLEEPLAAFYSWLTRHERQWQEHVRPNELILICDVGGGTTDFTLVSLSVAEGGSPRFERIAVGDHLILGGDNVDLALARQVETQLTGPRPSLDTNRWKALCHQCRAGKETILSGRAETFRVTLMGTGSRLIAGTVAADLTRDMVEKVLLEGFYPLVEAQPRPGASRNAQRPAITEFGLPYEPDPAITRHLCLFLERHQEAVAKAIGKSRPIPDLILFNGGSLKPGIVQDRIIEAIRHWFSAENPPAPRVLENPDLDLAVAEGAAYYGLVKIGRGVRVGSGSPRSFYLGIARDATEAERPRQAICLVERGLDEGSAIRLTDKKFEVLANQPVRFDLYSSSYRSRDRSGEVVDVDDTFSALPPLQTVIQYGKKGLKTTIPVQIEAQYTEMGTLALWCRSLISEHRWQLQFQLRDSGAPGPVEEGTILEAASVDTALTLAREAFKGNDQALLTGLVKQIAAAVGLPRDDWPLSLIRQLADALMEDQQARARSAMHEARWLNLTGFCLRPGFGDALDGERVKKLWKVFLQGPVHPSHAQVQSEWWIMWRRVAGGLNPGQQRQMSQEIGRLLVPRKSAKVRLPQQRQLELWMALANLERLYTKEKIQWGRLLLSQLQPSQAKHQHFWALARIGARDLLYGPADRVIPSAEAGAWADQIMKQPWPAVKPVADALQQIARRTGDRTRDLDPQTLQRVLDWMAQHPDLAEQRRFLLEVVPMARQEERALFGDSLPSGIVMHIES